MADTLRLLSGEAIDVLLLDLGLPDGSGLDLLATWRARHARVAVILEKDRLQPLTQTTAHPTRAG